MRTLSVWALTVWFLHAQQANPATPKESSEAEKEEIASGIPIRSDLVVQTCSPCHKPDEKGRLTRISWRRATPEGWEHTIKRMIELNGLQIEPAAARDVLRYPANNLGLAPA